MSSTSSARGDHLESEILVDVKAITINKHIRCAKYCRLGCGMLVLCMFLLPLTFVSVIFFTGKIEPVLCELDPLYCFSCPQGQPQAFVELVQESFCTNCSALYTPLVDIVGTADTRHLVAIVPLVDEEPAVVVAHARALVQVGFDWIIYIDHGVSSLLCPLHRDIDLRAASRIDIVSSADWYSPYLLTADDGVPSCGNSSAPSPESDHPVTWERVESSVWWPAVSASVGWAVVLSVADIPYATGAPNRSLGDELDWMSSSISPLPGRICVPRLVYLTSGFGCEPASVVLNFLFRVSISSGDPARLTCFEAGNRRRQTNPRIGLGAGRTYGSWTCGPTRPFERICPLTDQTSGALVLVPFPPISSVRVNHYASHSRHFADALRGSHSFGAYQLGLEMGITDLAATGFWTRLDEMEKGAILDDELAESYRRSR
jgi:hypothetical protein